jgi:outer membrane protein OmpA-like peptidoglycan-associated protein
MAEGYSWRIQRVEGGYRLPGPEYLGWWAAVAMLLSILLHVAVFFALERMKVALNVSEPSEISTRPVALCPVEVRPLEAERSIPPEEVIQPPEDAASLLEEVDLLEILPLDQEIDMKPEVVKAEYALQMQQPAMAGDPEAIALEAAAGLDVEGDLPEFGRDFETIRPAEVGQITVDPGSAQVDDDPGLGKFTDEIIKRGAGGKVENGALDGITSLDQLLDLPANILLSKKTMLPSDLLFDFNSSELRESAKVGLMKLALLMDRNPGLYCWIEGHTDLVGGDEFNLELSIKRAGAVKNYLVESMRMDPSKIITRGFGRYSPMVITGTSAEQAVNRRVEIRMRKTPPSDAQLKITPRKAAVVEEPAAVEEPAPRAVLVKPVRAIPVEQLEVAPPPPPLKAVPIEETPEAPQVPRAAPVELEPPAAIPRARQVEE